MMSEFNHTSGAARPCKGIPYEAEGSRHRRRHHFSWISVDAFDATATLDKLGDAFFAVDANWRFTFVNEEAARQWDRSATALIGEDMWEQFPELLGSPFEHVYREAAGIRVAANFQSYSRTTSRWYDVRVFPNDGGVAAFYHDATDLKLAEEELVGVAAAAGSSRDTTERLANELAVREEASRKDEFIATLAHELRNPLAPIRNALEVARLAKGNDVAVEYAHDVMDRQLTHMVRLIDELLDVSRLSLGRIELKRHTFDLASALETAIETSRPHIERSGVSLTVHLPQDVMCVDGDADRLAQVFSNLLSNAAKFTPTHGSIALTAGIEAAWGIVSVKDNGVGIHPKMLEQVFDSLTQEGDALNGTEGGLGLGLTLVKGLVELHGGTVEARSEGKGLGSEFIVRLPLSSTAHRQENGGAKRSVPSTTNWHRILVVDDNKDSATSLSMMLNLMGHDTRTASDGKRGLKAAEAFRPDVCLLDIGMPNLNGFEMASRLRAEPWGKDILLIALSGWGQEHDKDRSLKAGFDLHLVKPINPATLSAVLEARRPTLR